LRNTLGIAIDVKNAENNGLFDTVTEILLQLCPEAKKRSQKQKRLRSFGFNPQRIFRKRYSGDGRQRPRKMEDSCLNILRALLFCVFSAIH
jgi:hypothetical protein